MTEGQNRQLRLARNITEGEAVSMDLFELARGEIPTPGPGQFLVKTAGLGTSPAQRAYLMGAESRFHPPVPIGGVMRGRGIGHVVASNHAAYTEGDVVCCATGWQDYSVQDGDEDNLGRAIQKVADPHEKLYLHLGTLGASAFAAYFGLLDIGQPKPGETVVVSAAAGGVGSIVCQIARIKGCRVIGIAGGPEKCAWVKDHLGADEVIDYKAEDLDERFQALCPSDPNSGGIDVYFDNVGGHTLNMVMKNIAIGGRAIICGCISTEYLSPPPAGPSHYYNLIYRRARMEGFVVWDHAERYAEAEAELSEWYEAGALKPSEYVLEGLESTPAALQSLFAGANTGITVVDLTADG